MGHANVDTTLNVYTQVLNGSVREAVEKVAGELFTIVHRPGKVTNVYWTERQARQSVGHPS